jgi:hypothetical protein
MILFKKHLFLNRSMVFIFLAIVSMASLLADDSAAPPNQGRVGRQELKHALEDIMAQNIGAGLPADDKFCKTVGAYLVLEPEVRPDPKAILATLQLDFSDRGVDPEQINKLWGRIHIFAQIDRKLDSEEILARLGDLAEASLRSSAKNFGGAGWDWDRVPGSIALPLILSGAEKLKIENPELDLEPFLERFRQTLKTPEVQPHREKFLIFADLPLGRRVFGGATPPPVAEVRLLALAEGTDVQVPPPFYPGRTNLALNPKRMQRLETALKHLAFSSILSEVVKSTNDFNRALIDYNVAARDSGFRLRLLPHEPGNKRVAVDALEKEFAVVLQSLRNMRLDNREAGLNFEGFRGPIGAEFAVFSGRLNHGVHRGKFAVLYFDPHWVGDEEWNLKPDGTVAAAPTMLSLGESFQLLIRTEDEANSAPTWFFKSWNFSPIGLLQFDEKLSNPGEPVFKFKSFTEGTGVNNPFVSVILDGRFNRAFVDGGSSGRLSGLPQTSDLSFVDKLPKTEVFKSPGLMHFRGWLAQNALTQSVFAGAIQKIEFHPSKPSVMVAANDAKIFALSFGPEITSTPAPDNFNFSAPDCDWENAVKRADESATLFGVNQVYGVTANSEGRITLWRKNRMGQAVPFAQARYAGVSPLTCLTLSNDGVYVGLGLQNGEIRIVPVAYFRRIYGGTLPNSSGVPF